MAKKVVNKANIKAPNITLPPQQPIIEAPAAAKTAAIQQKEGSLIELGSEKIRMGFIYSEIFGKPLSKRKGRW